MNRRWEELTTLAVELEAGFADRFVDIAQMAHESIVLGSPITGAPGQPVGQYGPGYHQGSVGGVLRASWSLTFPEPLKAVIGTNVAYALSNEDGVARPGGGPYRQRSTVGGRHSVKLTVAGMPRIIDEARRRAQIS